MTCCKAVRIILRIHGPLGAVFLPATNLLTRLHYFELVEKEKLNQILDKGSFISYNGFF